MFMVFQACLKLFFLKVMQQVKNRAGNRIEKIDLNRFFQTDFFDSEKDLKV